MNRVHLSLAIACLASVSPVHAQDYPVKPVRMIIPVAAGGGTDRMGRMVSEQLESRWRQPVIVDNRAGAGGSIGAELLSKAAPDGYTLMFTSDAPLVINQSLYAKLTYDAETFTPVSVIAGIPLVLAVGQKVPADTLAQLINHAKGAPKSLSYGSAGNGSVSHLTTELFKSMAGIDAVHVPYKGAAPALTDLLGGRIDLLFVEVNAALASIKVGRIKALAVVNNTRLPLLPDVPLMSEAVPGFLTWSWWGVVAPPRTPTALAVRISANIAEVIKQPEMAARFKSMNLEAVVGTPGDMARQMQQDRDRWSGVIKASRLKVD